MIRPGVALLLAALCAAEEPDRPVTLVVVDATSGEPIPGARAHLLVHRPKHVPLFGEHAFLPAAQRLQRPRIADGRGAIQVEAEAGSRIQKLYVTADGRAWQAIHVLPTIGGEAIVRLRPGGGLRLHVARWQELRFPTLRAFGGDPAFATHVPTPDENGDLTLEGVPAGKVRIEVAHMRGRTVFGAGEAEIVPGKVAELTISTTPGVREGEGEVVRGTFRVPAAWQWPGGKVRMLVRGQGVAMLGAFADLTLDVPAGPTPVPFETTPLPPGRHALDVEPFRWRAEIEILEGKPLDLVVPEPRVTKLRFIDGATGAAVVPFRITCSVAGSRLPGIQAKRDESGAWVVRTASDRIEVMASARGYAYLAAEADTKEAATFRMHRSGNLLLRLTLAGRPFDGGGIRATIVREGHEDPPLLRTDWTPYFASDEFRPDVARFEGLEPGRWRLSLTDIAGIEPVREIVEIRAGETTEVVIDIRRAR